MFDFAGYVAIRAFEVISLDETYVNAVLVLVVVTCVAGSILSSAARVA